MRRGFTLIELLVVMTVAGLLTTIIMTFMVRTIASYAQEQTRETMLQDAQTALDTTSNAITMSAQALGSNTLQDRTNWTGNNNQLVLATAAQKSDGTILFSDPLHYISAKNNLVFYKKNDTLVEHAIADTTISGNHLATRCTSTYSGHNSCSLDTVLANNVAYFAVTYYDNTGTLITSNFSAARSIRLSITLSAHKYNKTISVGYTQQTVFRNQ